jgi:hypothetical protein
VQKVKTKSQNRNNCKAWIVRKLLRRNIAFFNTRPSVNHISAPLDGADTALMLSLSARRC